MHPSYPISSRRSHDLPRSPEKPDTGRRGTGVLDVTDREACEMQSAETVLGVIREREPQQPPGSRALESRMR
jgi:hypothetical protein